MVPSATLGDDFLIPADAEIVIEGLVQPGARVSQNPFGEITGHYQEKMNAPAMEVTGICFRDGAVMAASGGDAPRRPTLWRGGTRGRVQRIFRKPGPPR